jgi:hypothetical protein
VCRSRGRGRARRGCARSAARTTRSRSTRTSATPSTPRRSRTCRRGWWACCHRCDSDSRKISSHCTLDTGEKRCDRVTSLFTSKHSHRTCLWRAPARALLISRARRVVLFGLFVLRYAQSSDQSCVSLRSAVVFSAVTCRLVSLTVGCRARARVRVVSLPRVSARVENRVWSVCRVLCVRGCVLFVLCPPAPRVMCGGARVFCVRRVRTPTVRTECAKRVATRVVAKIYRLFLCQSLDTRSSQRRAARSGQSARHARSVTDLVPYTAVYRRS